MTTRAAYRATRERWPRWRLKISLRRTGPFWIAHWTGPLGGRYPNSRRCICHWGLTRAGAVRSVKRELARWTRKRRRVAARRAIRLRLELP